ncbi:hypothetical protein [Methylorubrum extorquens]|uniref:hypothetical protein n=1 Tax=Methylorubrum extorquens TaxID=408 RepID=UPI001EE51627|nr:hypothetical protein [Methylorubrum extorquens]MCG5249209.1 hypothetical protein [Methylorubrum extorquens]
MSYFIFQLGELSLEERADIHRATSITFEPQHDWGSGPYAASIEEAHDFGQFYFHLGFEDQPDRRNLFVAAAFAEAISTLNILRGLNPEAKLLLSCEEGEAEITGPEVCRGIINARASLDDPTGSDSDWSDLAEAVATCDSQGGAINLKVDDKETFEEIESYLLGQFRHTFELPSDLTAAVIPDPMMPEMIIPDDLDYDILLNRRRQRVQIGDRPAINMNPDDFVMWCRKHGVKLHVQCPMYYIPEFRSEEAHEVFRRRWMEG